MFVYDAVNKLQHRLVITYNEFLRKAIGNCSNLC